jgi:hypothetical protein
MVVDRWARSAEASRIVQWRLPICAPTITQFCSRGATSAPVGVSGSARVTTPKRPAGCAG